MLFIQSFIWTDVSNISPELFIFFRCSVAIEKMTPSGGERKNCLLWIVYLQWKDNSCINTTLFECHCLFKCLFVFMGLFTEIKQVSKKLTSWVIGFWLNPSIKSPCYMFNNEIIRHWISNSMWHVIHPSYPKLFKFISLPQQQFNLESQSHASTLIQCRILRIIHQKLLWYLTGLRGNLMANQILKTYSV